MRLLSFLGVAAQAEGLRLRRNAALSVQRGAWMAGAAMFITAAVALAHVAAIAALEPRFGIAGACGIVALADLVLAGLMALLSRRRHDAVAAEALLLRQTMLLAAARNPVRDATMAFLGNAPGPVLGAIAGEAIALWLRKR